MKNTQSKAQSDILRNIETAVAALKVNNLRQSLQFISGARICLIYELRKAEIEAKRKAAKPIKLNLGKFKKDNRVESVDNEGEGGVWIYLKDGFHNGNEGCHIIHEWDQKSLEEQFKNIGKCSCEDCVVTKLSRQ